MADLQTDIQNVYELVQLVRNKTDETNQKTKDDDDIVALLNEGQRVGVEVLARIFPQPLFYMHVPLQLASGERTLALPLDAVDGRVVDVYWSATENGVYLPVPEHSYNDVAWLMAARGSTGTPLAWVHIGNSMQWVPAPSGGWVQRTYVRQQPRLVLPHGRITRVGDGYLTYEQIGAGGGIVAESDQLDSYVNLVNWATGEVRGTFQVQTDETGRLTLRADPQRSSVRGRTISAASELSDCGVEADDLVCVASGTCVPFFQGAMANHLVAYGCACLRLALDGQNQLEAAMAAAAQSALEQQNAGRPQISRVQASSLVWGGGPVAIPYTAS